MSKSSDNPTTRPMRVVKFMVDDGRRMLTGTPLDLDGDILLIDIGQEIEVGTRVRLVPIADDHRRTRLFEFEGVVENTFVDVLVSAYADNRFILSLRVAEGDAFLRDLEAFVGEARATRRAPRKRRSPHRSELLASAFWAESNA